jgi:hypothetical protein
MEMRDRLATIPAIIDDNPESGFGNAEISRNVRSGEKEMADQGGILSFRSSKAGKRLFGNDENVDRSPGFNIPDGKTQIVLVEKLRRDFPGRNFFKKRHCTQVSCK